MMKKFPLYKQMDQMDCGPTCLRMIAKYNGKNFTIQRLRELSGINREGVSLLGISEAAEKIGFRSRATKLTREQIENTQLPMILHWNSNHFVVLYKVVSSGKWFSRKASAKYFIADPAKGNIIYNQSEFMDCWTNSSNNNLREGVALILSTTPEFYLQDSEKSDKISFSYLLKYLHQYKSLLFQLFLGLLIGTLLQLIFPFLTQSIVDIGINTNNLNFVNLILIAQLMLFIGRTSIEFIRSWILLHISIRINVAILTDFLIKLMKLPMSFYEAKITGDIMQRMSDQHRIESFLTGSTLNALFSILNLLVFSFVLAYYNISIFLIFLSCSFFYWLWIIYFLNKRRHLDFKIFDVSAKNQSLVIQLVGGMQEIKLNNCEQQKRWEWERVQAKLFRFNIKSLALGQYQQAGTFFINEGKNILITFIVAKAVINGELSLGAMLAIQYIIGQLTSPIEQMLIFAQQFQDAKIAMERLNEVRAMEDEEKAGKDYHNYLPDDGSIKLNNITFSYPGAGNDPILTNVSISIPEGKTTAIVGMSGSGKTTILKLLLRYYELERGEIRVGSMPLDQMGYKFWRSLCGTVMQEGFIFSDSIAKNIAVGEEYPDIAKINHAVNIANIRDFIKELPLGLNTKIGAEGNGISQGQKQRILIARAVYKNPKYIFFDEATNALDSKNENIIMANLQQFFSNRTVIIVAHRLSTVKNADNIIVMDKGNVIEQGTHAELIDFQGEYYQLVSNQLALA